MKTFLRSTLTLACAAAMGCAGLAHAQAGKAPARRGITDILRISDAATLTGLQPPPSALNLDVKPYLLGAARADRAIDPSFETDYDGDAGVDVKYGVTRGLTADFTYRTDFAQVEDDDQQVNLTRFNLFVPEKREFFLEGQGIFAFGGVETAPRANTTLAPVNTPVLFFSRQIGLLGSTPVPIEVGGRLTGRAGRYTVGVLNIQGVICRQKADQDQQDQSHPFLTVIRPVSEADPATRGQQDTADPMRRLVPFTRWMIKIRIRQHSFHDNQHDCGAAETDQR